MDKILYREIMWAEMSPDLYDGDKCDEICPRWYVYAEGDMDGDYEEKLLELSPKNFPPGTKITISLPCCPKCGEDVEECRIDDDCDFDWDLWRDNEYQ